MLTIAQIRQTVGRREVVALGLDILKGLGFQTTAWGDGSIQKTFLSGLATLLADLTEVAKGMAEFTWNDYASGAALTEFSKSHFDNTRIPGIKTSGSVTLSSTASINYTITPGKLIATNLAGQKFTNTTGGTLNGGSTLTVTWQAVKQGEAGNGSPPSTLVTPLAGVSLVTPADDPWYTTAGADEESDRNLRIRNRTKWATLSIELVRDGYFHLALSQAGISKVYLDDQNPRGPRTIDVYVSAGLGLVSDAAVEALQEAFALRVLGVNLDTPEDGSVLVRHANRKQKALQGTVYYDGNFSEEEIRNRVVDALDAMLTLLPLGGKSYSSDFANVLTRSEVYAAIEAVPGVDSCTLQLGDTTLEGGDLLVFTYGSLAFLPA